jgi:hypothetical protein
MSGFPATCDICHRELKDVSEVCPKCGPDAAKTVHMETRAQMTMSATVRMTILKLEEEIYKNWPLLFVLIICDLISVVPAYFLSGVPSVAVTVFFIILSTVLGYFAITRVITITRETR